MASLCVLHLPTKCNNRIMSEKCESESIDSQWVLQVSISVLRLPTKPNNRIMCGTVTMHWNAVEHNHLVYNHSS